MQTGRCYFPDDGLHTLLGWASRCVPSPTMSSHESTIHISAPQCRETTDQWVATASNTDTGSVSDRDSVSHYSDVIMGAMASQITSLTIVYSTVYSDADQRNIKAPRHWPLCGEIHRGPVNSPHKWPVTRKMFPFDDVIMWHGTPIRITGPLWGFPYKMASYSDRWYFLQQPDKRAVEWPVIWDTIKHMWRHCNDLTKYLRRHHALWLWFKKNLTYQIYWLQKIFVTKTEITNNICYPVNVLQYARTGLESALLGNIKARWQASVRIPYPMCTSHTVDFLQLIFPRFSIWY